MEVKYRENNHHEITFTPSNFKTKERGYTAFLRTLTRNCFFGHDLPISLEYSLNNSMIEGEYSDYKVGGAFFAKYKYSRFNCLQCNCNDLISVETTTLSSTDTTSYSSTQFTNYSLFPVLYYLLVFYAFCLLVLLSVYGCFLSQNS